MHPYSQIRAQALVAHCPFTSIFYIQYFKHLTDSLVLVKPGLMFLRLVSREEAQIMNRNAEMVTFARRFTVATYGISVL